MQKNKTDSIGQMYTLGRLTLCPFARACEKFNKVFLKIGIDFYRISAIIELPKEKETKK